MNTTKRILLVDDEVALRQSLAEQLELHENYETTQVDNGANALQAIKAAYFAMVLHDLGLPDVDGREVSKLMRRRGFKGPIIMLTGRDSDSETILGLDSGANDYVTKPFRLGVLLARIRAHLHQHDQSEHAVFPIGPYTFRPTAKLMIHGETNRKVRLTHLETAILKYLYRAGEKFVSRDVLLSEVWGYNAGVTTHTPETHIYRLRQKIEPNPSDPTLLVSEPSGYRLNG